MQRGKIFFFAILLIIWLQIGWKHGFFTIPLSPGKVSKSNSGKKWTALSLCLAGGPIFYTGWAPPDFNAGIIAMYRSGRSVQTKGTLKLSSNLADPEKTI